MTTALVDLVALAGAAAIVWGTHQVSPAAAWIVGGSLALFGAWRFSIDNATNREG